MPEAITLHFSDNKQGQVKKVLALKQHEADGWTVISETIAPGRPKGNVCGLPIAGGEGIITVILIRN